MVGGEGLNGHDLFGQIVSLENLFLAWQEFRHGKKKRHDVQEFEFTLEDNIFQLHQELANRTYLHGPYQPFYVTDPKLRHIHKATVRDRLLHHAIFRILYPIFDRTFIYDSYACRHGKGTHRAVRCLEVFARKVSQNNRYNFYALKCDIKKFFDSVDQQILRELVSQKVPDTSTHWLIDQILFSFEKSPGRGLPLGNVTSQLFANIYMGELDQFMKRTLQERFYLRYCDDFIALHCKREYLENLVPKIQDFLTEHLKLSLHPSKIFLRKYSQGVDFLGYVIRPHHTVVRTKTKNRILRRIVRGINSQSLQSYIGILNHCNGYYLARKFLTSTPASVEE